MSAAHAKNAAQPTIATARCHRRDAVKNVTRILLSEHSARLQRSYLMWECIPSSLAMQLGVPSDTAAGVGRTNHQKHQNHRKTPAIIYIATLYLHDADSAALWATRTTTRNRRISSALGGASWRRCFVFAVAQWSQATHEASFHSSMKYKRARGQKTRSVCDHELWVARK